MKDKPNPKSLTDCARFGCELGEAVMDVKDNLLFRRHCTRCGRLAVKIRKDSDGRVTEMQREVGVG